MARLTFPFKKYKLLIGNVYFMMRSIRRSLWELREHQEEYPKLEQELAALLEQAKVLKMEFLKMKTDSAKGVPINFSAIKAKHEQAEAQLDKVKEKVKKIVENISEQFEELKEIDFDGESMEFEHNEMLNKLNKALTKKVAGMKKAAIERIKKQKGKDTKAQVKAATKQYNTFLINTRGRLESLHNKFIAAFRENWKASKRQAREWYEPRTSLYGIAEDQLRRETKVKAKEVFRDFSETRKLTKAVLAQDDFNELNKRLNELITRYSQASTDMYELIEMNKIMLYRIKEQGRTLQNSLNTKLADFHESKVLEIKKELAKLAAIQKTTLEEIEEQSRFIMNEAAAA